MTIVDDFIFGGARSFRLPFAILIAAFVIVFAFLLIFSPR